jgi:6-phosphofructokinase 1
VKRAAIVTSGGDAPGMNACIRAFVRYGTGRGLTTLGVRHGYAGLIRGEIVHLGPRDVGNIIQRGGTILRASRSVDFRSAEGRERAAANLRRYEVEGLVVCGGNGTMQGALELSHQWDGAIVGVPASIDNDINGTDTTIGFDTAVNTALDAIDRIRDTAEAQERVFLVEVMGRNCGAIARDVALAGGAVGVLVPDVPNDLEQIVTFLESPRASKRASNIIVVAEGDEYGGAFAVAKQLEQRLGREMRVTVLGHTQRGGSPTAASRILATRMGAAAVDALLDGAAGVIIGLSGNNLVRVPLEEAVAVTPPVDAAVVEMIVGLAG